MYPYDPLVLASSSTLTMELGAQLTVAFASLAILDNRIPTEIVTNRTPARSLFSTTRTA
jgi:hypothetical protein